MQVSFLAPLLDQWPIVTEFTQNGKEMVKYVGSVSRVALKQTTYDFN